jgi:hypothetical protein
MFLEGTNGNVDVERMNLKATTFTNNYYGVGPVFYFWATLNNSSDIAFATSSAELLGN